MPRSVAHLEWPGAAQVDAHRARARAALRNLILSMLSKTGVSVPAARESFAFDYRAAIHPVTGRVL